jgi:2-methylisocitrate lyase-like PEP mutase family enzyme
VDAVRDRVKAHLDAGADHVCVQAVGADPLEELRRVAPSLREL